MSEERYNEVDRAQEDGQITYANEVISTIVTVATTEVEGIAGISGGNGTISGIIGRSKLPRGVKVDVKGDRVSVDISVSVDYGIPIQKVGRNCQENVRKSIETMTGLKVEKVDLHVISVSFEKENKELQQSQKLALSLDPEPAEEKQEAAGAADEEAPSGVSDEVYEEKEGEEIYEVEPQEDEEAEELEDDGAEDGGEEDYDEDDDEG